jgi:galactokinase
VEAEWAGAKTGLLDQLASLCGEREHALLIDFATLSLRAVPLRLGEWRLAVLDSGERHANARSGYNERRAECAEACRLLHIRHVSETTPSSLTDLPEPLRARVEHVLAENTRVNEAVAALEAGEMAKLGPLLDASHASLRDLYDVSTPALERAVATMRAAGASGARLVGGGFGGSVLGLFAPGIAPPSLARELRPGAGAHVL